jgi:hypothetical protein
MFFEDYQFQKRIPGAAAAQFPDAITSAIESAPRLSTKIGPLIHDLCALLDQDTVARSGEPRSKVANIDQP